MSRIAVLADIHGNFPALEAVLADVGEQRVDEVLFGGDLVGRGPEGSKVVRRVVDGGWACVRGNHEDYLLSFRNGGVPESWLSRDEWAASRWMAAELGDRDAAYIDSLPFSLTASRAPQLRLVHGSPKSQNEGIGPWSTDDELDDHASSVEESLLVCAHTHRPLLRRRDRGLIVNVGAVGLPFNRDPRAQYAIFEERDGQWEVEFRKVEYDRERFLRIYETSGFLSEGGVTAQLLKMEVEWATPFLVPFLKWAATVGAPVADSQIPAFLDFFDPEEPMPRFFKRLGATGR